MPKIFIASHGSHPTNDGSTFVPGGMVVKFIVDFQENALFPNALAVISSGGLIGSREDFAEGEEIPNYALSPLDERQQRWFIAAQSPNHGHLFLVGSAYREESALIESIGPVGERISLCGDDVACRAIGDGQHHCQGFFGRLHTRGSGHVELYMLNCRGTHADAPVTVALGDEEKILDDADAGKPGAKFGMEDNRHLPTTRREYEELSEQWLISQRQDVIDILEGLPEATRILLDASAIESASWVEYPLSVWGGDEENFTDDFPDEVRFSYDKVPPSLMDASVRTEWRHGFYLYLHGPAHSDANTRLTFTLWSQLRKALAESDLVSPYVEETIAHFNYRYPGILNVPELLEIEFLGGSYTRLWGLRANQDFQVVLKKSLTDSEYEAVERAGIDAAVEETHQHFHRAVVALYDRLTQVLEESWPAFTGYIHGMWEQLADERESRAGGMDSAD
ncbi:MAG: hypothetical protein H0T78_05065 [Longispora sp.]|nr:hypothetical protein [Longispora sp. (in: high G+C Gram-positive bacteria)]